MKKFGIFILIIGTLLVFRSYLFNLFFTYKITGQREISTIQNHILSDKKQMSIEEIIKINLKETSSLLSFTFDKCENNPDKLIKTKKANCIGYSAFFASVTANSLKSANLNSEWKVKHQMGEIYFLNVNINQHLKSNFFKDHDFVTIENSKTKEIIAVDPSLFDYFRINNIKLK